MRPRHFNAAAQRGHLNGAQDRHYMGHYVAAHTGTGVYNVEIALGPGGLDRQTAIYLHCVATTSSLSNIPTVTLGGLKPIHHYNDKSIVYASESSHAVVVIEFDTSKLGPTAQLSITPVQSQLGFVIGVWSLLGYHRTSARGNSLGNVATLDIEDIFDGEIIIAGFTHTTNADTVAWTVGATNERYDADSGSTIAGSGADEFSPTPASPYTVTLTEGSTIEALTLDAYVPKRGKDDRLMYMLRPTGGHGTGTFEDASWRRRQLGIVGTPVNEYTGRYHSSGAGAVLFDGTDQFQGSAYTLPSVSKDTGWCMEWWEYSTSLGGNRARAGGQTATMFLAMYNGLFYASSTGGSWDIANAVDMGTEQLNTWVHRAITWTGSHWYIFEDGVLISDFASSLIPYYPGSSGLRVGSGAGAANFIGRMEDFAVWRYPKYTAAFTPPALPLTA